MPRPLLIACSAVLLQAAVTAAAASPEACLDGDDAAPPLLQDEPHAEQNHQQLLQTGSQVRIAGMTTAEGSHFRGIVLSAGGYSDYVLASLGPWVSRIIQFKAQSKEPVEWAVMMERQHLAALKAEYPLYKVAFNYVMFYEEVAKEGSAVNVWSSHGSSSGECKEDVACMAHVKSMKLHAMRKSPFQETIFMDVDTKPCGADFHIPLFNLLYQGEGVDMAVQPILLEQWEAPDAFSAHGRSWFSGRLFEHSSALVVYRHSMGMSYLLDEWVHLFHNGTQPLDQPSLQLTIEGLISKNRLRLNRIPVNTFCRRLTATHLSCSGECSAVHLGALTYPESFGSKVVLVGAKHTGASLIQKALESFWAPTYDAKEAAAKFAAGEGEEAWLHQTLHNVADQNEAKFVLEGTPWDVAPAFQRTAEALPRAMFVLTTRDAEVWWKSIECHASKNASLAEKFRKGLNAEKFERNAMKAAFESYNSKVIAYFERTHQEVRLLTMNLDEEGGVDSFVQRFCDNYLGCKVERSMELVKRSSQDSGLVDECGM